MFQSVASPSNSQVQRDAERLVLDWFGQQIGQHLSGYAVKDDRRSVDFDGFSADRSTLVEVYARMDEIQGGQRTKCAADVLKLGTHGREIVGPEGRLVFLVSHPVSSQLARSWIAESANSLGVEILPFQLPTVEYQRIRNAQFRQGQRFRS